MAMKKCLNGKAIESSIDMMGRSSFDRSISPLHGFVDPQSLFSLQITRLKAALPVGPLAQHASVLRSDWESLDPSSAARISEAIARYSLSIDNGGKVFSKWVVAEELSPDHIVTGSRTVAWRCKGFNGDKFARQFAADQPY